MSLVHILAKEEIYFSKIYSSSAANIAEIFNHSGNPRKKNIYIYTILTYSVIFFTLYLLIVFLAVLGLCRCAGVFFSCGEQVLLFVEVCGLIMSNLPFELRRKAGDCSRVTAGPIDLI